VLSSVVRVAISLLIMQLGLFAMASSADAQLESPLDSDDKGLEKLPFRNSSFSFGQSLSSNSFFRNTQQSYNPSYVWGFSLYLAWHFDDQTSIALEQGLEAELTDSDTTRERQRPLLSDTRVIFDRELYQRKLSDTASWALHGAVDLYAPTSLASQAATLLFGARLGVAAGLSLPKVLDGMAFDASVSYLHRFLRSNMVEAAEPYPCFAGGESRDLCTQLGGTSNTRNSIRIGVGSQLALSDKWGVFASLSHVWRRGADLADSEFISDTGGVQALRAGDVSHWRNSNVIELGVTYAVLSWLGLGFNVSNDFAERGPAGDIREPFRLNETYLGFDADLKLDQIYLIASGRKR
jgi:hypothetical protein